jgi:hypothetical protein
MKALAYFFIIPASITVYFVLAASFGIYQRYPVLNYLLMGVGIFLLIRLLLKQFSVWRLLLTVGGAALAAFFGWWTLSYSNYEKMETVVARGEANPQILSFELKNSAGESTTLNEAMGDADVLLLNFYRGHW